MTTTSRTVLTLIASAAALLALGQTSPAQMAPSTAEGTPAPATLVHPAPSEATMPVASTPTTENPIATETCEVGAAELSESAHQPSLASDYCVWEYRWICFNGICYWQYVWICN